MPVLTESYFRPLLFFSKDILTNYLISNNLIWMEDLSNQDIIYKRNMIRHNVIPILRKAVINSNDNENLDIDKNNSYLLNEKINNLGQQSQLINEFTKYYVSFN